MGSVNEVLNVAASQRNYISTLFEGSDGILVCCLRQQNGQTRDAEHSEHTANVEGN